ncbi:putative UPF0481 protein At3g02645 [Ipomoea triloba]|uniref:putative UPF0481 protein At3g02645 n=1 Tax=Ipomoea triloba TaxID=35885 RepID=UPI00125D90CD|nr:putative UPF0481 protein At3g02645 [Ipomoea triloba]
MPRSLDLNCSDVSSAVCKSSSFANYIFKKEEEEKTKIEEIQIPSASELSKKFNVDFKPTRGGIRGINFQTPEEGGGEANTLYLPEIKLESGSEVVLRNLVAYELKLHYSPPHIHLDPN